MAPRCVAGGPGWRGGPTVWRDPRARGTLVPVGRGGSTASLSHPTAPLTHLPLSYQAALEFLFPRTTTIKFGLDTTRALLAELGDPDRLYPTIHVGGTNGKGSVSTLIAEALRARGLKVGLYTSPHLVSFRERILVNGAPISEAAVAAWTERLMPLIRARQATFFEATTAIALADFAARGVEIAVVEVGLGGRLDSTNVLSPLVSGVTKIEKDHMKYLGDTLERIALEKAGIAKPGCAVRHRGDAAPPGAASPARRAGRGSSGRGAPGAGAVAGGAGAAGAAPAPQRRDRQGDAARAPGAVSAHPRRRSPTGLRWPAIPAGSTGGGSGSSTWRTTPTASARWWRALASASLPRPIHALVSILGDKAWPEMLVRLDAGIDRGVLTVAPTAEGAAGTWNGSGAGSETRTGRPRTPPGRCGPISRKHSPRCSRGPVRCWSPARSTPWGMSW